MSGIDTALEQRVQVLLGHLDEMPAIAAALPLTVEYLIGEIREVLAPARGAHAGGDAYSAASVNVT